MASFRTFSNCCRMGINFLPGVCLLLGYSGVYEYLDCQAAFFSVASASN